MGKIEFSPPQPAKQVDILTVFGRKISRQAVEKWLSRVQCIQDKLLACTHLSSGSPGRTTELETLRLFNSEYALRNFYISQGRVVVVTRYSKIRSLTGWDRVIPRFPDPETSNPFLTYLLVFRNLENVFIRALYGVSVMKSHMHGLFIERGKNYTAARMRDKIRRQLHAHGIPIGFNHFRHFAAAMVLIIAKSSSNRDHEQLFEEATAIAHLQVGHSQDVTEMKYARKASEIPSLPSSALNKYRQFSSEWHRYMNLVSIPAPAPQSLLPANTLSKELVQSISSSIIASVSLNLSENLNQTLRNNISHLLSTKKRSHHPTPSTQLSRNLSSSCLRLPPKSTSEADLGKYLPSLRNFLKDPHAMFKNDLPLQATAATCEARENLMVLMPTGSGKTLPILLTAFLESTRSATVIIVPIAALVNEYVDKCRNLGLSVATWTSRSDRVHVYVISTSLNLNELQFFLRSLQNKVRLKRLVLDEAHLFIIWFVFRPAFRRLLFALKAREHHVQVVLLTATLPPSYRDRLISNLSLSSVALYHQSSDRKNLKFEVLDVTEQRSHGRFPTLEEAMTGELCQQASECAKHLTQNQGGRVMIFALYQQEVDRLQLALQQHFQKELSGHIPILRHHAGMSKSELDDNFAFWKTENHPIKLLVGTSAIGSGVHAPNVRACFHFGGANGILEYVQETGRASRDDSSALCMILYNKKTSILL